MPIAVGFRCSDGVVIATDSQYSQDISKGRGQKIFPNPTNGRYAVTIGGAGGSDQIKWTVAEIERSLDVEIGAKPTAIAEIREIIEAVLLRSYAENIDPAPPEERQWLGYDLLIGIWTPQERALLFKSQRTIVVQVAYPNHVSIGQGSYLTDYVLAALFDRTWMLSVDEATTVSAYIVAMANEHIQGCGGSTFVRVLDDQGHDVSLGPDEVSNAVEFYGELFRWTSNIRSLLSHNFDPEAVDMLPFANILRDQIVKFRKLQDGRRTFADQLIAKHGIKPIV